MRAICAWCKAFMGERPPLDDDRETHGICGPCLDKLREEHRVSKEIGKGLAALGCALVYGLLAVFAGG